MRRIAPAVLALLVQGCADTAPRGDAPAEAFWAVAPDDSRPHATTRRVLAGGDVDFSVGGPSPDGRSFTITDWSTGDLVVRDLATGAQRRLTHKGSWEASPDFAEYSRFSPEGERVAYGWYSEGRYELRMVGLDGAEPRVLLRDPTVVWVRPHGWTPDGASILTTLVAADGTVRLALIPATGGTPRTLKHFDWRSPAEAGVSPDGRYVAYDFPAEEGSARRDIYLLALDGGRVTPLVRGASHDLVLGWIPDGRLLFASDRGGTPGAWAVDVEDGAPRGAPVLVRPDLWRSFPLGFTATGSYFYGVMSGVRDVHIATVDLRGGTPAGPATPVSDRAGVRRLGFAWSPDGEHFAYVARSGATPLEHRPVALVVQSLRTGEVREIVPRLARMGHDLRWSPDGGSILLPATDTRGGSGLFRVDLRTGEAASVARCASPCAVVRNPAWSPAGDAVLYVEGATTAEGTEYRIVRRELSGGSARILHAVADSVIGSFAVSPDGRTLAFGVNRSLSEAHGAIHLMPAAGGPRRELLRLSEGELVAALEWMPDGSHLVFARTRAAPSATAEAEVWVTPVAGGEPRPLGLSAPQLRLLRVHPDGRRVGYFAGRLELELWLMEGLHPPPHLP
jgi:Tol biopolymer transport system component